MRGSLHGSNYTIMFYHKPSPGNPTYVSLAIHSRSQAQVKGEGCVRPRQPTQNFIESLRHEQHIN